MKWAKRDILRIPLEGEEVQASLSFTENAIPGYMNIRRIESVDVKANLSYDAHSEVLLVDVNVKGKMILPCSISFQDVPYSFKTSSRLAFSFTKTEIESDVIIVEGEELDFDPEILALIWMEVPPRVISPKIKDFPHGEGWEVVSEEEFRRRKEEKINPRFAKILEYKAQDDEEV